MVYEFNTPYRFNGKVMDPVETYEVNLQVGDVILMATDGLLDWVHTDSIVKVMSKIENPGDCAMKLVKKAKVAMCAACPSYFKAVEQRSIGLFRVFRDAVVNYVKADDISVVVSRVMSCSGKAQTNLPEVRVITDKDIDLKSSLRLRVKGHLREFSHGDEVGENKITNFHGVAKVHSQCDSKTIDLQAQVRGFSIGIGHYLDSALGDVAESGSDSLSGLSAVWDGIQCSRPNLLAIVDAQKGKLQAICADARILVIRRCKTVIAAAGKSTSTLGAVGTVTQLECEVRSGDIIVAVNGFVFDRLFQSRILRVVNKNYKDGVATIAEKLVQLAKQVPCPFVEGATVGEAELAVIVGIIN